MTKYYEQTIVCLLLIICESMVNGHVIRNKPSCIADYLKKSGQLESDYPSTYDGPKESCDFMVGVVEGIFYDSVRENIDEIHKSTNYESCIMANLKKSRALEYVLKLEVYQDATHLSNEEKVAKVNEMGRGTVEEITISAVKCQLKESYGEMFDNILNVEDSSEETEDDDKDEYCVKKYVVDNQIIDAKYTVILNRKNIDVSEISCDPIVRKFLKTLEDEFTQGLLENDSITPEYSICAKNKMLDNKAFDKIIALFILKDLALTDQQKNEERQVFVELMTKVKLEMMRTCDI